MDRRIFAVSFVAVMAIFAMGAKSAYGAVASRPMPVPKDQARTAAVTVWGSGFDKRTTFETFEKTFLRGAYLASGDVDGDGAVEIVVGSGQGRAPEIRVYAADGTEESRFNTFVDWFRGGVRIAAGDLDGDGIAEIVAVPGPGIPAEVSVYDAKGNKKIAPPGALAYPKEFVGGVRVAVGDLDRDGSAEIITAPGPGGGPHVRVFTPSMEPREHMDFFAYDAGMTDGVTIAVVRTHWGSQLVTGVESWSEPLIRRYSFDANGARLDKEFFAFATSTRAGTIVGAFDLDGDGTDEILASANGRAIAEVRFFDLWGTEYRRALLQDPTYLGALSYAELDTDGDGRVELATVAAAPMVVGPTETEKSIYVDLTDQRLYAYERGRIAKSFFISSGVGRHPSPVVKTAVLEKIPVKRYAWSYGPGNPDNYDLSGVKWNMRIYGPYYIHGAYWHNNFGTRMSHGCINVDYANAEWIYDWASVGTPVQTANGPQTAVIALK